jgi:NAD(P)H-quinone oxidoreductase subunit 5
LIVLRSALLLAAPFCYLLAACMPAYDSARLRQRWQQARVAAITALLCAFASTLWLVLDQPAVLHSPNLVGLGRVGAIALSTRSDVLGCLVLLLVSFIGWVIVVYSQPYLAGERAQGRYIRSLMLTLASVSLLVISNNLGVLALAWLGTSLALHQLLTFFSKRPQALIVAHKKFLASRMADICLFSAIALIGLHFGSIELDVVQATLSAEKVFGQDLQLACALLAIGAMIKCAQLPFHGWLIQVMEAPTPVSALLHAGVVNLGGFLLIRLHVLMVNAPIAQTTLVLMGSLTAAIAALVMMTRISIKVSLAWSTCAQMGFMLMQCGLGLYELALLHLIAHSLYKAHAFLSSGSVVDHSRIRQMTGEAPTKQLVAQLFAVPISVAIVVASAWMWGIALAPFTPIAVGGIIIALAWAPALSQALSRGGRLRYAYLASVFALTLVYFGLHHLLAAWIGTSEVSVAPALLVWVAVCFGALYLLQSLILSRPNSALVRRLYPGIYAGLYLDDAFTRLTFWLWPAKRDTALPLVAHAIEGAQ